MNKLIQEKDLIDICLKLYESEDTSKATSTEDFMYRCGVSNAMNYICSKLGINITSIIREHNMHKENSK